MSSPGVPTPTSPYSSYFRRRTIGRASSPPTWACYEQIPSDDEDDDYNESPSEDESCSEDGEEYAHHHDSDGDHAVNSERQDDTQNMEIDRVDHVADDEKNAAKLFKKDMKGKQRALDPDQESAKKHYRKRERRPTYTLRPILTIQKSQGFVWNQDLFVPPYIKDRYVASTSPPSSKGFASSSWTSTTSSMTDYEVEVVEIRVGDGELYDIIP
ncbi:hypothetical protein AZE42_07913 [Rhizopogon vesiculosus]|uniref:Uncharacterized protein n=1 Tax=Rhizopogon vesiculosus TaxID=180088 RepID=A0A1J8PYE0_9AGAM|nr:hypothetical protein AZE42_07913 [Rhizopogon vesiculosus]